jgi:endonuclease/exonuclease/phosphatase family metal-dependent hydrolase
MDSNAGPVTLKVMNLNVAHGRGLSMQPIKQFFEDRETIESNLTGIAELISRESPGVVALQEADGPSFWSGDFNHVDFIAKRAGYEHSFRGEHMCAGIGSRKLSYGTAMLSRFPLSQRNSFRFARSLPTPRKGFVVAAVTVPGPGDLQVDVVSVHLDFLRKGARREQISLMVEKLSGRKRPLIIMGDMNHTWEGKENNLRILAGKLNLKAYKPAGPGMSTFPSREPQKRLDWILISRELEFVSYRVLSDKVSDHLGIISEVKVSR